VIENTGKKAVVKADFSMGRAALQPVLKGKVLYTVDGEDGIAAAYEITWLVRDRLSADLSPAYPRFGVRLTMPEGSEQMRYFGYGPMESYIDKRLAARLSEFSSTVTENYEPYVRPQENSSHYGCRWAKVTTTAGHGFLFTASSDFLFNASHYTQEQLTETKHHYELQPNRETTVTIDYKQNGIGSQSCGPELIQKYRFDEDEFSFTVRIQPVFAGGADGYKAMRTK